MMSAKNNVNIQEAFNDIFEQLYKAFEPEITGEKQVKEGMKVGGRSGRGNRRCC